MNSPRLVFLGFAALAVSIAVGWYLIQDSKTEIGRPVVGVGSSGTSANTHADRENSSAPPSTLIVRKERADEGPGAIISSLAQVLAVKNQFERHHALQRFGYDSAKLGAHVALGKLGEIS